MSVGSTPLSVGKSRNVALFLAMIGWTIMSCACKYSPPHPPTYADFKRLGPGILEDEKKLEAQRAVYEAAQFQSKEIEAIRARGVARELVGAALQAKVGNEHIEALLREAIARGSNDPVVLAGVAVSLVGAGDNGIELANGAPQLVEVLAALERFEPDNGLPQYVRAHLQLKQGDTNGARLSVMAAARKPRLGLHSSDLRHCVVDAALAVKYPRYTAFALGLGTIGFNTPIFFVGRGLLTDPQVDRATAEACLELARRQETQATWFIDQLMAAGLQRLALDFLKPPGFEQELQRIKDVRDRMKEATIFLDSPKAHTASERDGLAYFETLFKKSEYEAVDELARKLNHKL